MTTLAFDVYGTLIDTAGVTGALEELIGGDAAAFAAAWRQKQLEYTFRYGLMARYRNFRVCTRQALEFCCEQRRAKISARDRDALMKQYLTLPAFNDVADGLQRLSNAKVKMFAFSNGVPDDLEVLLGHAGLRKFFAGVVSVDEVQTFKPSPAVYQHFVKRADADAADSATNTWLISGNPFDVCGARAAGWRAVWLRRNPSAVFDAWGDALAADHVATSFNEVAALFAP